MSKTNTAGENAGYENKKSLFQNRVKPMGMPRGFEKPKNFKNSVKKLIAYCKPYLFVIIVAVLLAVAGTILTLLGPNKLTEITNIVTQGMFGGIDMSAVAKIGLFLVIIYSLSMVFSYLQGFIMATITQRVSQNLRRNISRKINRLPLKYLDSKPHGEILSRVTNDVDTISQTLNQSVVTLVSATVLLIGSLIMMFLTNWIMALSAIGAISVGMILMVLIMSKSQKYFNRQQSSLGEINGHIEEIYSGHNIVKAYNGEEGAKQKFRSINNGLFLNAWKSQFLSGLMMPIMTFMGNLGYVVVCVVGASLVVNNQIEFGVIVAFMIYIRLFSQPLGQLAQAMTSVQSAAAASERVFEFLEEKELEEESCKSLTLTDVKGNVEFKNIKFGYNPDKTVINDFSIKIKAGQKVAIVGPTGAGKTTIVNLLMRFYEINNGEILIDDIPINQLTRENVHNLFGMVLQDTWMFEGTIKENIIYSKTGVSDEDVYEACRAIGIDHFIKTLPNGYDTVLDDNTTISAGQKQLVTIARAMIQNSPMLILDEATSSVDTRTEILIQKAMDKITKEKTAFVIAHRLSTIKNADIILVMKEGEIVETGNHKDLIKANGYYSELYNSQFD